MSTVHICLKDIFGVAVACNVIFYPEDTPFANGTALAVSGAHSILIDADGTGSVTLLPGRYTVRFAKITGNTDSLIILVPITEGAYELTDLICSGNWALPMRDFLSKSKNLADVDDPAGAFGVIKQTATTASTGAIQLATQAEVDDGINASKAVTPATLVSTRTALSGKADATALAAHASRTDNPHAVTKAQVGLANVDNTSDANKPVSIATQAALDAKASLDAQTGYLFFGFNMQSLPSAGLKLAYGRSDASGVDFRLYSYTPLFVPANSPTFRDVRMAELNGTYWMAWTRDAWNYTSASGIGLAYSTDLIHWTQATNIPTTTSTNGACWGANWWKEPGTTDYTGLHIFWEQGAPDNSVTYESHPLNASLTSWSAQAVISGAAIRGNSPSLKINGVYILYNDNGVAYTASSYLGPYTAAPQYNIVPAGWAAMKLEAIPGNVIKLVDRYRAFIDNSDPIVNGRTADLGPAGTATNCYYCDSFDLLTWGAPIPFYPGDFLANGNIIPISHAVKSALDAKAVATSLSTQAAGAIQSSVTTTPTPTYSSNSGGNKAWNIESWLLPAYTTPAIGNRERYVRGLFMISHGSPSLQIAPYSGWTSSNGAQIAGVFTDRGMFSGTFAADQNAVNLLTNTVSGWFKLWNSGVLSIGLRYRFSVGFSANAGDVIVLSPSGHTFIVDKTITDATAFTDKTTGGVFVRAITSAGVPSGSDTSLTVNGGSAITTTLVANSATNTSSMPEAVIFPSSTGWHVWNKFYDSFCYFTLVYAD